MQGYLPVKDSNIFYDRIASRKSLGFLLFIFPGGCLLNGLSYFSLEPILVAVIFLAAGMLLLKLKSFGGYYERRMFLQVFSVCWFMAGIAAIYLNFLQDTPALRADERHFFWRSTSTSFEGWTLFKLSQVTEGSLAVFVWRYIYDVFSSLNFDLGSYIGVIVNVFIVSLTGVFAVKIVHLVYGNDVSRHNRLLLMFSLCGMLWLFAALHIRDAFSLLTVTFLVYMWTLYLTKTVPKNFIFLVFTTLIVSSLIGYIRIEFVFVPFAMFFAGLTALSLFQKAHGFRKLFSLTCSLFGFIVAVFVLPDVMSDLMPVLSTQSNLYLSYSTQGAADDSLGMSLIMNQPLSVRVALGSVLLFVFPIPFWSGFQLESAYHFFKSCNVVFFYFLTPLFLLSLFQIFKFKAIRTSAVIFNLFVILGFTPMIAATSVENRHFGTFLVPLFIVALLPDLTNKSEKKSYKNILAIFLATITIVHMAWAILKIY